MDFIAKVESYLKEMNYKLAALEILNPDNLEHIHAEGMDLISKLCDIGLQNAVESDDVSTCSELLNYICSYYNPKLALVSTLEQAEAFMMSDKFSIIFSAVQVVFARHASKRAATYSWVLELVTKHLKAFHRFPEELNNKFAECEDVLLLENDPKVRFIFKYYKDVCTFYVPIVAHFLEFRGISWKEADEVNLKELEKQEKVLKCYLVDLLGLPLVYFDLAFTFEEEPTNQKMPWLSQRQVQKSKIQKQKTEARLIAEKIMNFLSQVNVDSSFFLKWTERKYSPQPDLAKYEELEYDDDDHGEVKIECASMANYFYLLYVEKLSSEQMPMMYTTTHLFRVQIPLIMTLLGDEHRNYLVIQKGLELAQKLIGQLSDPLESEFLTEKVYSTFVERLTEIIVFSESTSTRQLSLHVLKAYFWAFVPAGKFMFLQFVIAKIRHSGLIGYMIIQLKDCLASALNGNNETQKELKFYFFGEKLSKLLLQICTLENGETTDLIESKDQIIGALNLLRFLLLRDGVHNESGILNEMSRIETVMLKPLRTALDLTKAHYKLKLKEIEEPSYKGGVKPLKLDSESEIATSVIIGMKEVNMADIFAPVSDEIKIVNSGLLSIDIMESLLARLNECYSHVLTSNRKTIVN